MTRRRTAQASNIVFTFRDVATSQSMKKCKTVQQARMRLFSKTKDTFTKQKKAEQLPTTVEVDSTPEVMMLRIAFLEKQLELEKKEKKKALIIANKAYILGARTQWKSWDMWL